jgi:hypothetical protein
VSHVICSKDEIAASQNQTAEKGPQSLMEGGLPETPKMLQAREEYTIYAWKNSQDAFAWQSVSTKVIFVVVIIVVLAGLYLSWMQFNFAHNAPLKVTTPSTERSATGETRTNPVDAINTIEVNTSGVKITSSVIGLNHAANVVETFRRYSSGNAAAAFSSASRPTCV